MQHQYTEPKHPERVVILGSKGFLGQELSKKLKILNIPFIALSSSDIDLTKPDSIHKLGSILKSTDTLVMFSAITPDKGRDLDAFMRNITMAYHVCAALKNTPVAHTLYLSSDAVYAGDIALVSDNTQASTTDLYGTMHKTREVMFQSTVSESNLAILRLTITYGFADTHNSYGPNRFRRLAEKEKKITLFGNGEETRDHIFIEDAIQVIVEVLRHKSYGVMNLASGKSYSFMEVAEAVAKLYDESINIEGTPRKTPITHRHYDITLLYKLFPNVKWHSLEEGLKKTHKQQMQERMAESV